jgi:NAD(P)-dependent dehydrogenase (short-subunit alcohol dehydrogenase family)
MNSPPPSSSSSSSSSQLDAANAVSAVPALLTGRVALVTGAARGIGKVIAAALESSGCVVWRLDRDLTAAGTAGDPAQNDDAHGHEQSNGKGNPNRNGNRDDTSSPSDDRTVQVDVRDRAGLEALAARIAAVDGGLDILVNNAGTMTTGGFDKTPADAFQELVDTNLVGIFHCVQLFAPHLRRGGSIVNIASVSAQRGGGAVGNVWYGATKAGVVALTSGLARELGPRGIRVNAISPAVVDTALTHAALTPEVRSRTLGRLPLGRLAESADVADATVFLCSQAARFITGATLTVDGGFLTT